MADRTCLVLGCGLRHAAKGLCATHYTQKNYPNRAKYKVIEIPCAQCGAAIQRQKRSDRTNQFCSFPCRSAFRKAFGGMGRPRTRGSALVHVGPAPDCDVPVQHPARRRRSRSVPRRVFLSGPCRWCSEPFTIVDQTQARFCSKRCANHERESRAGRFRIPPGVRKSIYERDRFVCQLCFDPVDMTLPHTDVWAATLDHIECQSWALHPDHSPANLRLAHRWCNSVRGDESFYTADVLSA